jgi:ketosteroid isomerase-like protein
MVGGVESDNVRLVRELYRLFNELPTDGDERRGSEAETAVLALFHEDVVFVQPQQQVDGAEFRGRAGVRGAWADWLSLWVSHRSELVELLERDDRVLALSHEHMVGRDGLALDWEGSSLFTLRDGLIVRFEGIMDAALAREKLERG